MKYSFRLSIFWVARLNRTVTWSTSIMTFLSSTVSLLSDVEDEAVLGAVEGPQTDEQHQNGGHSACDQDQMAGQLVQVDQVTELTDEEVHGV